MNFTKDKNKLFWIINAAGWIVLLILTLALYYNERLNDYIAVIGVSITYLVGFIVSVGLRYLYRRFNYRKWSITYTAFLILIISAVVTHIWYWADIGSSIFFLYGYEKRMWLLPAHVSKGRKHCAFIFPHHCYMEHVLFFIQALA